MNLLWLSQDLAILCCKYVEDLISAGVSCLVGGSVSERSHGSKLVDTAGVLIGLPCSSSSSRFSLVQPQTSSASVHWLGINISIWLSCLWHLSEGTHNRLFCDNIMASVIVSGLGASSWALSQFWPVTGPSFSQPLLHFHPCSFFRQEPIILLKTKTKTNKNKTEQWEI